MKKYEYPEIDQQKTEHEAFKSNIKDFLMEYKDWKPLLAREILLYLGVWYREHIINIDKKFGRFLEESGEDH